jgi:hypothetical protein
MAHEEASEVARPPHAGPTLGQDGEHRPPANVELVMASQQMEGPVDHARRHSDVVDVPADPSKTPVPPVMAAVKVVAAIGISAWASICPPLSTNAAWQSWSVARMLTQEIHPCPSVLLSGRCMENSIAVTSATPP